MLPLGMSIISHTHMPIRRDSSLIGAVAVICGLYIMLWGKSKDQNIQSKRKPEEDSAKIMEPLLAESLHDPES